VADAVVDVVDGRADALERLAGLLDGRDAVLLRSAPSPTTSTTRAVSRWISTMRPETSPAAACDSSASARTSSATTANPRPSSTARPVSAEVVAICCEVALTVPALSDTCWTRCQLPWAARLTD
jgi:hypothetical protein